MPHVINPFQSRDLRRISLAFAAFYAEKEFARAENSCYHVRKPCGE